MPSSGRCLAVLILLLPCAPALAGPWPRAEKGMFLSLSDERDRDGNNYIGLYGEYGLTGRETLGFELGHTNVGETSAIFWLQHGLEPIGENRFALSLGLGMIQRDGILMPVGQAGADWGRGFGGVLNGGWMSLETRVKVAGTTEDEQDFQELEPSAFNYLTAEVTSKADLTLGLHATDRTMFINQLRLEQREDTGFSSKIATSVVHDLIGPAKIELGLITPISGPDEEAVKVGTWLEF
ncbi:hypothetical protein RM190_01145 [Paracoccus sp. CPCC 101403]|uniref:Uncharacterized protein n=2 Tax=Paracoccus broussonetiae TaxID=3075834 RepID=A0ABU3E8F3_9RHOB|nr:hypothetical protein [Paracoccus sp. CPCC 101403]MDT1060441.1 hypothetical protein [Paracoccus sp. CPCC 101403]